MQPLASTMRHSAQLCSVHVGSLEEPLESLPPEPSPEQERKEFGQQGVRRTEAAAATHTPLEVPYQGSIPNLVIGEIFPS